MNPTTHRLIGAAAAFCAGLALTQSASAVDLRSWDQKIEDATKRFVVLAAFDNQVVLDRETQLVWRRSVVSASSWAMALQHCHSSSTGGRYGWRMPSYSELLSLLGTGGYMPAGHPFQGLSALDYYWSSTDLYGNSNYAHTVKLLDHVVAARSKAELHRWLCVRGIGVVDRD